MPPLTRLQTLQQDFSILATAAGQAVRDGNMELYMTLARAYHRVAREITDLTGVDPRPAE